jgi:hypothetical protein
VPFPPVVESFQSEEEAFLSSFRINKHSFDVPWLVGMNSDEGLLKTAGRKNPITKVFKCLSLEFCFSIL